MALGSLILVLLLGAGAMLHAQDKAQALRYTFAGTKDAPARRAISIKQTLDVQLGAGAKAQKVEAIVDAVVEQSLTGTKGEDLDLQITFMDLTSSLKAQGQPVPGGGQLGAMRMSTVLSPQGKVQSIFTESVSPQFNRTLGLLKDAFLHTLPVVPKDAIAVGHTWSDTSTSSHKEDNVELAIDIKRDYTLSSMENDGKLARIGVVLDLKMSSAVSDAEDSGASYKRSGNGSGKGTIVFDLERGVVTDASIELSFKSTDGNGASQQSKLSITVTPEKANNKP